MGVTPHYPLVSPARDAGPAFRPARLPGIVTAQFPALAHCGRYRRPRRWAHQDHDWPVSEEDPGYAKSLALAA